MGESKDNLGTAASPDVFSLSQSVQSMLMDMDVETRAATELAAQQAMENPEDFVKYVIIILQEYRLHIDTIVGALLRREILKMDVHDAPRA